MNVHCPLKIYSEMLYFSQRLKLDVNKPIRKNTKAGKVNEKGFKVAETILF